VSLYILDLKKNPIIGLGRPYGLQELRISDFKTIGIRRWQSCQPYAPAAFTPRKYTFYIIDRKTNTC
jgi:hypothetical protein